MTKRLVQSGKIGFTGLANLSIFFQVSNKIHTYNLEVPKCHFDDRQRLSCEMLRLNYEKFHNFHLKPKFSFSSENHSNDNSDEFPDLYEFTLYNLSEFPEN